MALLLPASHYFDSYDRRQKVDPVTALLRLDSDVKELGLVTKGESGIAALDAPQNLSALAKYYDMDPNKIIAFRNAMINSPDFPQAINSPFEKLGGVGKANVDYIFSLRPDIAAIYAQVKTSAEVEPLAQGLLGSALKNFLKPENDTFVPLPTQTPPPQPHIVPRDTRPPTAALRDTGLPWKFPNGTDTRQNVMEGAYLVIHSRTRPDAVQFSGLPNQWMMMPERDAKGHEVPGMWRLALTPVGVDMLEHKTPQQLQELGKRIRKSLGPAAFTETPPAAREEARGPARTALRAEHPGTIQEQPGTYPSTTARRYATSPEVSF